MALKVKAVERLLKFDKEAAGEVIKAWATEGHSVPLPGLGNMRFGLRSKSVEKVEDPENENGSTENGGTNTGENGGGTSQGGSTGGNTGGGGSNDDGGGQN